MKTALFLIATFAWVWPTSIAHVAWAKHSRPGDDNLSLPASTSLLLNNRPLEYALFSVRSRGMLRLVANYPESAEPACIPFRIYRQRGGTSVSIDNIDSNEVFYELDIYRALVRAIPGDNLVIEPVSPAYKAAKRIVRVNIIWLWLVPPGQGC
ncbi:hypothetical protein GCM10023187_00800 [Nibrella viscosa]|uniref:Uncharacterized protein n=1 Tax=Nibrella viscosa TaxID=1084524 RepID=A0ABP8JQK2_9BACT